MSSMITNNNMNSTDIADQLRGSYRPDRWMGQRKWWWAFFIWAIGVVGVNAYKIYEVFTMRRRRRRRWGFLHGGHMRDSWKNSYMISFSLAIEEQCEHRCRVGEQLGNGGSIDSLIFCAWTAG
jgi:hypothetical protein